MYIVLVPLALGAICVAFFIVLFAAGALVGLGSVWRACAARGRQARGCASASPYAEGDGAIGLPARSFAGQDLDRRGRRLRRGLIVNRWRRSDRCLISHRSIVNRGRGMTRAIAACP